MNRTILLYIIFFLVQFFQIQGQEFQLASPQVKFDNELFSESIMVTAYMDLDGVSIKYLTDAEPQVEKLLESSDVEIIKDVCLSFWCEHIDFLKSEAKKVCFINLPNQQIINHVVLNETPNPPYESTGAGILYDRLAGSMDFRDGKWLGFKGKDVPIEIKLTKGVENGIMKIGILRNVASWITGPREILLYGLDSVGEKQLIASKKLDPILNNQAPHKEWISLIFKTELTYSQFELNIKKVINIPDGHPGDSENVWIFIDEIIIK